MQLLRQVSFNRVKDEISNFYSNIQPSPLSSPNTVEKQLSGVNTDRTTQDMKELKNYRNYKKKQKKHLHEKELTKNRDRSTPILPNSVKKEINRAKVINKDEIAPTI